MQKNVEKNKLLNGNKDDFACKCKEAYPVIRTMK